MTGYQNVTHQFLLSIQCCIVRMKLQSIRSVEARVSSGIYPSIHPSIHPITETIFRNTVQYILKRFTLVEADRWT